MKRMILKKETRADKKLKDTKDELAKRSWVLQKTGEALKALYKEIDKKNEELKKFDKLKSQFVANVSHEFKNPLFVIDESLKIVLDGLMGDVNAKQEKMLKTGKRNVERLIRLVNDMLDLAKIEAGKMEIRREHFDISALVNEILTSYEGEISKKQIILNTNIPPRANLIWADKDKISEVVINLLSNALKYTPLKGNVSVKLVSTKQEVRFEISDSGSGIKKQDFEKIFDKFERVTTGAQEGTGLGLPITKDIIELHKGKIWVESEIKKGSNFIFVIPKDFRDGAKPNTTS